MQSLYSFARFFRQGIGGGAYDPNGIAPTIISNHGEVIRVLIMEAKIIQVMNLLPYEKFKNRQIGRVYSTEGIAPCLDCQGGGMREPKIIVMGSKKIEESIDSKVDVKPLNTTERVYACAMRGREDKKQHIEVGGEHANSLTTVQKDSMVYVLTEKFGETVIHKDIHPTILAEFHHHYLAQDMGQDTEQDSRIRKLTERECYRLMDVAEEDIDKLLASDISKSQHYKLTGNSIVVSCLYYIFKNLFSEDNDVAEGTQLTLF